MSISDTKSITAKELLANEAQTRDQRLRRISERHIMEEKQILKSLKKESNTVRCTPRSQNMKGDKNEKPKLLSLNQSMNAA